MIHGSWNPNIVNDMVLKNTGTCSWKAGKRKTTA
jgi:hypothetical protein